MQFFATLALCRAPATFPSAPLRRLTPAHLCISCPLTLPRCRRTGHGAGFERRCTSFLHPPLSCLFDFYYAATERRPRACAQPRPSVPDVCVHLAGAWLHITLTSPRICTDFKPESSHCINGPRIQSSTPHPVSYTRVAPYSSNVDIWISLMLFCSALPCPPVYSLIPRDGNS
jgi:hypothetical protein